MRKVRKEITYIAVVTDKLRRTVTLEELIDFADAIRLDYTHCEPCHVVLRTSTTPLKVAVIEASPSR